ncbi:MAG TPA: translation elongation factor Ts [Flexilinea sp.]|nr:elongation factor Ts [Flexilinea sp.]HNY18469.1 translation elongation factor Ts [Flexilinea sp.]HPS47757.1 translation elongation factor Ts [Flexilinea sp.]HQP46506.1 translation elongation factor Ts [Flexilinea sp.]
MGTVSTDLIKQLRESTGAGILECRKALENANGDLKAAMESLREKGLATALKRSSRAASEGVIEVYTHGGGRVGVMLELNCETDFVGRSESFRYLAHELALQIAASSPLYISDEDIPQSVLDNEAKIAEAKAREEGKSEAIIPKIVEGYLKKYKDEVVLLNQIYIRDESIKVQDLINQNIAALGENIIVRRFARYALGESSDMDEAE